MVKPGVSVYFRDRHLETHFFLGKQVRVGRLRDNEIVLDNIGVSRHHARIFVEGENFVLEDLRSANGTRVNGTLADRVCLSYGDQISIGKFTLVFHLLDTQSIPRASDAQRPAPGNGGADRTTLYTGDRIDLEPLDKEGPSKPQTSSSAMSRPGATRTEPRRNRGEAGRGVPTPLITDETRPAFGKAPGAAAPPPAPSGRPIPPGYYVLLVFKEGEKLAQKPLDRKSFSIGRSSDNDLILSGTEISRYHSTITRTEGGFHIEDMASRNGVSVNRVAVTRQYLSPGDEIEVGKYRLVFVRSDVPPIEKLYRGAAARELIGIDEPGKTEALDSFARELMTDRIAAGAMSIEVKAETPAAPVPHEKKDLALFQALEVVEVSLNYRGWVLDQSWPIEANLREAPPGAAPNTIKLRLRFPAYSAEFEIPLNKMRKVPK